MVGAVAPEVMRLNRIVTGAARGSLPKFDRPYFVIRHVGELLHRRGILASCRDGLRSADQAMDRETVAARRSPSGLRHQSTGISSCAVARDVGKMVMTSGVHEVALDGQ